MRTSMRARIDPDPALRSWRTANGFTLVELMIVLFVVGLMAGVVVMTIPGDERTLASDSEKLAVRLAAGRDLAIVRARSVGVRLGPSGYGFEERRDGMWAPVAKSQLPFQKWSSGTSVSVNGQGAEGFVTFDSTGFPSSPMAVALSRGSERSTVELAGTGEVRIVAP